MSTSRLGQAQLGQLRLSQLAAAGNPLEASAESQLSLTDEVIDAGNVFADAESPLALTSTATGSFILGRQSITNLLMTTTCIVAGPKRKSASSPLTITDTAEVRGPFYLQADSPILLTQFAHEGRELFATASSPLTFTQTTTRSGTLRVAATSTIALADFGDHRIKLRNVVDTLELAQTASAFKVYRASSTIALVQQAIQGVLFLTAESTLELEQRARPREFTFGPGGLPNFTFDLPATEITLTDSARSSIKMLSASSPISVSQDMVVIKPVYVTATSPLIETSEVFNPETLQIDTVESGLVQSVGLEVNRSLHAENVISFYPPAAIGVRVLADAIDLSATSTLTLVQDGRLSKTADAESLLSLDQLASGIRSNGNVESTLALDTTSTASLVRNLTASSSIAIGQSLRFIFPVGGTVSHYSPFVGEAAPGDPTPPSNTLLGPNDEITVPFQLFYPAVGTPTDSVTLRAPNLGNKDRLTFTRINRETRGGTLIVYSDPIWPRIQTLVMSFSGLNRTEGQSLLTFMQSHLGLEVGLIDYEKRLWIGVITNPQDAVIQDSFDRYTASFEFEGTLSEDNPPVIPAAPCSGTSPRFPNPGLYRTPPCECEESTLVIGDSYVTETDDLLVIGMPVYIKISGNLGKGQANAAGTAEVVGFSLTDTNPGFAATYVSEGQVVKSDWTAITGGASLTPGSVYYLDPTTAGRITSIAPTTIGHYVVSVGRAVSATVLDIEIQRPIRL